MQQDGITLDMIRANLDAAISTHSENCQRTAVFDVVGHPGIDNLLMACEVGTEQLYFLLTVAA